MEKMYCSCMYIKIPLLEEWLPVALDTETGLDFCLTVHHQLGKVI